ncbi:hypothetical protein DVJ83_02775 [Deinococcus wulumuqiensis]|uniref:Uncharacterized protein n=1 Tax=Deinococcus wulumuqiensis TaxID=980427 RepID=A0A345IEY6_9DEIO|nr:hypothetical protein DVJ83_02775 [Deinococcus wulumuqiensis]
MPTAPTCCKPAKSNSAATRRTSPATKRSARPTWATNRDQAKEGAEGEEPSALFLCRPGSYGFRLIPAQSGKRRLCIHIAESVFFPTRIRSAAQLCKSD